MLEKINQKHETETAPTLDYEQASKLYIEAEPSFEQQTSTTNIEHLRQLALKQPEQLLELPIDEKQNNSIGYIDKQTKKIALNKELDDIRRHLSTDQRLFSKVIHLKTVSKLSSMTDNTLARPSALLVGGLFAFLGSLAYLMLDKYIGQTYNYFVFIILFVFGYLLSILITIIKKSIYKLNHRH